MFPIEFPKVFFFCSGSEQISCVFLCCEMVQNGIPSIFIFQGMDRNKLRGSACFSLLRIAPERYSELYCLLLEWLGTEFRAFLFRETEEILPEWIKISVGSEFHGIIFFTENANPKPYKISKLLMPMFSMPSNFGTLVTLGTLFVANSQTPCMENKQLRGNIVFRTNNKCINPDFHMSSPP
jgi:hypothetical protein